MNGPSMFSFALREVPKTVKKALLKNKISQNKVDYFIFHQANKYMIESIGKKLQIKKEKIIFFNKYGNTTSSTIPIALYEAIKTKKIKNRNRVMLCGFGLGASWSTTVITVSKKLIDSIV